MQISLRRLALLAAPALIALALNALAPVAPARANDLYWTNGSGGSALDAGNWWDDDDFTYHTPGVYDLARFSIGGGFNVQWAAPVDTIGGLDVSAGAPRFNIAGTLDINYSSYLNTDSLTLLSGTLRTPSLQAGWSGASTFLGAGGSQVECTDSTLGSTWGRGYRTRVTLTGGSRIKSNGWIEMANGLGDRCTTTVIGRQQFGGSSGLITQSAAGGGYRGDMIVGTNGTACLQLSNGGFADIAGDLFLGKGNLASGTVHVYNTPGGAGFPSLTVHGETVLGVQDPADYLLGWGEILAERGSLNLIGPCLVQNGQITVRNGASLTASNLALNPSPHDFSVGLSVRGTGSNATITSSLQIGAPTMPPTSFNAVLVADSNATLTYAGPSALSVHQNGEMWIGAGAAVQSAAEVDVWGLAWVDGLLQAPIVHVKSTGNSWSTVQASKNTVIKARMALDPWTTFRVVGFRLFVTVGDSTATDGFVSSGYTWLGSDTLVVLDKDGAELGTVDLIAGVMRVPSGGHIANGMYMFGPGRFEGNLTNEGNLSVRSPSALEIAGKLTQLTGLAVGDGTLSIPTGSVLSARGSIDPLIALGGSLDFGPTPSLLSAGHGLQAAGTATMNFRLGSKVSGIQDAIFVTGAAALGGKLEVRSVLGNIPNAGDTITILTASSVSGTFSSVKYNGNNPAGGISVLYGPTSVRILVINGALAVQGDDAPGQPLRFACSGTLHAPAMALDLPGPSTVKVTLYDVTGRQVAVLANGSLAAGRHQMALANSGVASGVYFGRAVVTDPYGTRALTARVVLLR